MLSALKCSPNEMYSPQPVICCACCGLPRNPCMIHACVGLSSLYSLVISSMPLTQWIISGFLVSSESLACAWNTVICVMISAVDFNLSIPHSPMAMTFLLFASSVILKNSFSQSSVISHGCRPTEVYLSSIALLLLRMEYLLSAASLWVCRSKNSIWYLMVLGHSRNHPKGDSAGCV